MLDRDKNTQFNISVVHRDVTGVDVVFLALQQHSGGII